jgi:hypothetical protein
LNNFRLVLHKRLCKKIKMDVENSNWGEWAKGSDLVEEKDELASHEQGLFIPVIENETQQERAKRILALMDESNDRLHRVLSIFDRMNR